MSRWFPGQVAAAVALLVAGCVLVAAAVWIARRRRERPAATGRAYAVPARIAVIASAGIAATVTTVVVVLGIVG
jgi:LPXTG-motif cell wall-anchored protein